MRRGRIFLYLLLILVVGMVLVVLFFQRFMQPDPSEPVAGEPTPTPEIEMVDVVVVTQRVSRGQVVDEQVLGTVPYQRDLFIEGMFTHTSEAAGNRAKLDLEPGFVLTRNMVADSTEQLSSTGSDAALLIPRGMVAVSIPINRLSSVSYAPQRGDHVNVIITMLMVQLDEEFQSRLPNYASAVLPPGNTIAVGPLDSQAGSQDASLTTNELINSMNAQSLPGGGPIGRSMIDTALEQTFYVVPSEPQRPRLVSQTLIQDVIVLQVGNFSEGVEATTPTETPEAETTQASSTNQAPPPPPPAPPDIITLIVSPQDAVTLNYLLYSGAHLTLALRGVGDDSRIQTEAVTLQYLLEQYYIPVPIKLPFGLEPRIDELIVPTLQNDTTNTTAP